MIKIMRDVLKVLPTGQHNSRGTEYTVIVDSIDMTSKLIVICILMIISGGVAVFIIAIDDPLALNYGPGLWNRAMHWLIHLMFSCGVTCALLSA